MGGKRNIKEKGFALLAALLILILVSALAIALIYATTSEQRIGQNDLENNLAYYGAEAGMEKMMSDLGQLYQAQAAPSAATIQGLSAFPPALPSTVYPEYAFNFPNGIQANGAPSSSNRTITTGANAGLAAQIVPMQLAVTATRPSGAQVRMTRTVEVAMIPVFQFGIFSDSDLSTFAGPTLDFTGRVHTNGNFFLAAGGGTTFHAKITAFKDVIRTNLANGWPTATNYTGATAVPTAPNGCDGARPACRNLASTEGSLLGTVGSGINPNWTTISQTTYNGMILNGRTGAKNLQLPFVQGGVQPIEIIHRPLPGELPTSAVGQSREYNLAQIRVLLDDNVGNLPGGAGDPDNVFLDNVGPYAAGVNVGGANYYFADGIQKASAPAAQAQDNDWALPVQVPALAANARWPLIGGWLRVEYRDVGGVFHGVTREWLSLGFARGLSYPNSEQGRANTVHPNAILIFQMQADRNLNGVLTDANEFGNALAQYSTANANSMYAWYPINFYDTREGEVRDTALGNTSCALAGVMNAVELDVNNLRRWLAGTTGVNGPQVESASQNGYILYFSDRRGMLPNSQGNLVGSWNFEDNIDSNTANPAIGGPNGVMEAAENVDGLGTLDNAGATNLANGFANPPAAPTTVQAPALLVNGNPWQRITNCTTLARKNRVTGARHVLIIENGSLGNVPMAPGAVGGFTVVGEQPAYVLGDYNASVAGGFGNPHASSAVIADTVTLLSNAWTTLQSLASPTNMACAATRCGSTTWYRVAIASGKVQNFTFYPANPYPASQDWGTDGGVHNFLRYLEDWNGTANYSGSMVSFYYSQYGNGTFKCCSTVYSPPTRAYAFDTDFLDPSKMPPGTPKFLDVVNIGFTQDFTPR
jgi:Tfp pilus assembly protein PilX